jgi:hypothetical protein
MADLLRRALVVGSISLTGLCGTSAHADPITVTRGSAFLYWDGGPTSVRVAGSDLLIFGEGFGAGTPAWEAGRPGDLDGSFAFSPFQIPFEAIVNGTSYVAFLEGGLSFTTLPFIVPDAGGPDAGSFRTTFSMTGRVRGYSAADRTGSPLFDVDLVGNGIASTIAFPVPGTPSYISRNGISYEFAPLARTPEPGTILLLATGVLGLGLHYRTRVRVTSLLCETSPRAGRGPGFVPRPAARARSIRARIRRTGTFPLPGSAE